MQNPTQIVETSLGLLRGQKVLSNVIAYLGIPFAAAPVGRLRWCAPQPLAPWTGIRDATCFGPDCPQPPNRYLRAERQDEDCLYLNIWAPADTASTSYPVMVWVHGGGFAGGSGSDVRSDGAHLAENGVIVVSFNYRIGLFGFLAHPELSQESARRVSGNWGLLDQLAALRWVRTHIRQFGGDTKRITAFGVSAGAASLSLMLASPATDGLFDRAILQSPGACRPLATLLQAEEAGLTLGESIAELRALSPREIGMLAHHLSPKVRGLTTPRILRPIKDGWLLPEDDRVVFRSKRIRAVPILVGSNTDEGSLLTKAWSIDTLQEYEDQIKANFIGAESRARALYPVSNADARTEVARMFADTQFNYGTRLLSKAMAEREHHVWRYLFTRRTPIAKDGPHHGEEVSYVFGNLECVPGADEDDRRLSNFMIKAWISFADMADPNGGGLEVEWPSYNSHADNHLELGDSVTQGSLWRAAQLDFLDSYYG